MNALRNKVQLIGRLGKAAETITFDDGKVKARFPVATNEHFRNGEGEKVERTQWHDVIGSAAVDGEALLDLYHALQLLPQLGCNALALVVALGG